MEHDHALEQDPSTKPARVPWNKGKLVGVEPPLRPSHVWSIRTKLQIEGKKRDLALFNLAPTANCEAATWSPFGSMTLHCKRCTDLTWTG
jgi:hypothetical protein